MESSFAAWLNETKDHGKEIHFAPTDAVGTAAGSTYQANLGNSLIAAATLRPTRRQAALDTAEAERIDRTRNPSDYIGKCLEPKRGGAGKHDLSERKTP
jgi:hypothetical protein